MSMTTSANGRKLIERFEGCKLHAYKVAIGIWTIGYGHTSFAGPPRVHEGLTITQEEADELLAKDLAIPERTVNDLVKVPLTQNQFDALVSLVYNVGAGNFRRSSVLKSLNYKDYKGAARDFRRLNTAAGKVLRDLVDRRAAEAALFLKPNG